MWFLVESGNSSSESRGSSSALKMAPSRVKKSTLNRCMHLIFKKIKSMHTFRAFPHFVLFQCRSAQFSKHLWSKGKIIQDFTFEKCTLLFQNEIEVTWINLQGKCTLCLKFLKNPNNLAVIPIIVLAYRFARFFCVKLDCLACCCRDNIN